MKKYSRKKTAKRYTRKRRFTRKRAVKRASLAETRYFKMKMTGVTPVEFPANAQSFTAVFARFWNSGQGQGNQQWVGVDSTPRWRQCKNNYQEYAITGFSVRYVPSGVLPLAGQNNSPAVTQVATFEDLTTPAIQNMNDPEAIALSSYRIRSPRSTWNIWMNNKPLARVQKTAWRNTQTQLPNGEAPGAAVAIRFTGQNMPQQAQYLVGHFRYTYYVTFRGQRYQAPNVNDELNLQTPRSAMSYVPPI